jgi:hypothetical protein
MHCLNESILDFAKAHLQQAALTDLQGKQAVGALLLQEQTRLQMLLPRLQQEMAIWNNREQNNHAMLEK